LQTCLFAQFYWLELTEYSNTKTIDEALTLSQVFIDVDKISTFKCEFIAIKAEIKPAARHALQWCLMISARC